MRIIARNVRTPSGEIDLLAQDGDDLVFCEVRTRRSLPGDAAESLTGAKLVRMWQCGLDYCEANDLDPDCIRVDVISLDLGPNGTVNGIEHFRGVDIPG
jgi:putative endonuclease